jgi:carboxyl-terminal processing protease
MRALTIAAGLLIGSAHAVWAANPGDVAPRASSEFVRSQATAYSSAMMNVFRIIDDTYIRPVPKVELARAALVGLYEAAREPIPASLWAELAQAKQPGQIAYLLETARERLGDLESLRDHKAVQASVSNLSGALDPFSGFPPSNRRNDSRVDSIGVGIEFDWKSATKETRESDEIVPTHQHVVPGGPSGPYQIDDVLPGSPAQRAGVRPGDVITRIDDFPVESPDGRRLFDRLFPESFEAPEKFRVTLQRPGVDQPFQCDLTTAIFTPETVFGVRRRLDNSWDFILDRERRIGYVRLGFIDGTIDDPRSAAEMEIAIDQLKKAGAKGLIFDLRGCPGGFLEPAKAISGMFIKSGLIATYKDSSEVREGRKPTDDFRIDNGSGALEGIATIVLIDGETRGGGEMVAAVLQDHKVARMAGHRTYGKASVQKPCPLMEAGIKQGWLTTGSFTRPNGKNLHRYPESRDDEDWGISPDKGLTYMVSPELRAQVKEWMKLQILRPGDGRQPLPPDDPDNDPLRAFACRELIKQVK